MARPDFTKKWASSRPSIPAISDPDYALGFANYLGAIPPSTDDHDYIMNLQDERDCWLGEQMLNAVGHEWQSDVTYDAFAVVRSPVDGQLYRSLVGGNLNNEPSVSGSQWALGVADSADTLNAPVATVAAASTISLAVNAPGTSQILISGSAGITSFVVESGRVFFVRFSGVNTLVNSVALVTNSGANILTAAGDSCVLRATAANTVEVLLFTKAVNTQSLTTNGYKVHADGSATPLIEQWGRFVQAPATTGNIPVTFPIPFPNECFGVTIGEYTGPAPNWIALSGLPTASGFVAGSVTPDQGYMWFAKGR